MNIGRSRKWILMAASALWLAPMFALPGCGERDFFGGDDVGLVVVDGVLIVGQPLPPIFLSRSLAPDEFVTPMNAGIRDATVFVEDQNGRSFEYLGDTLLPGELVAVPGRYLPAESNQTVEPNLRYELYVETVEGEVIRATTTTPPPFGVDEWVLLDTNLTTVVALQDFEAAADSIYSVDANRLRWGVGVLEARFDRDARVPAYQVGLFSLDPGSDFTIDPDFFDDEDFADLDRESSSPMFDADDGFLRLPWFAVFFEGRTLLKIFAVDQNWNDLVRTSPTLNDTGGFGGNAGDDFDRPVFHIDGGIGLFGSAAVDSIGFFVLDDDL